MYIPSASNHWTDTDNLDVYKGGSKGDLAPEKWASLIGIVTAICGNILISFALNTQRYAHMRLSRDREEWELKQRRERRKNRNANNYGSQQAEVAEQRARVNQKADQDQAKYTLEEPRETDPLIPSVDSLASRKSSGSVEDTPGLGEDEDNPKEKSYLRSPIWWLGISMMTVGEAGNFLAYGFAPASIVSPLGVVALISNCLIAPFLLRERFRWRDGLGVVIAVMGCVTIVMSASTSNPKLDPDKIWSLITRWEFETYLAITVVLILVLMWASNRFGDKSILIDLGLMGLFGGYTALSTKGVASLLSNSVWRVVTFPITYLLVAVLVGTAVMQIKYVNRALQRFNSTMVIPTQFVLFTISVILGSAILYRDFERTTTDQAVKFIGGCALTFLGVWFITSGRGDDSDTDEESEDEEDAVDLVDEEGVQPEIREREDASSRRQSLIAGTSKDPSQFQRYTSDDTPTLPPPAPDPQIPKPADMSPAGRAGIHDQSTSSLPLPPSTPKQKQNQTPTLHPPQLHATTSSPEVPTTFSTAPSTPLPQTPLKRNASTSTSPSKPAPSTPTPRPGLQEGPASQSQRLLNRHSVAGLLPGPITSPLSSSLSAIVAETLRRGVDHGSSSSPYSPYSLRRPSFKRAKRKGVDPDAAPRKRHSIASGEMDFGHGEGEVGVGGRGRSLSATLQDLFGPSSSTKRKSGVDGRASAPDDGSNASEGR